MISIGMDARAVVPSVTVSRAVFGTGEAAPGAGPGRDGKAALLDATTGRALTYADLAAAVGSAAAGLARAGVRPGAVVALHLPDSPEFAVALHAVTAAGAVPFPVRATVPAAELARLLRDAGARVLITWPVLLDGAQEAASAAGVDRVYCFGDEADAMPFSALLGGGAAPDVPLDPVRDTALLACTRGVTGPYRAVPLTHAEVVAGLVRVVEGGMLGGGDVVLSALPFSDVLGLNGALNPALRLGATVVTLAGAGRHDLLRALQDHRVTLAVLPPRLVETLAYDRAVPRYHLRSLRAIVCAGGPLDVEAARACAASLGCPVRQAYGIAEAAGLTHLNPRAAEEGTLDSVGRELPGVRWRVASPRSGAAQPAYQPGELCVRLPATRAAAAPARWLPTGDAAFSDAHGRVYVLGRLDGGSPEPPAEPETVLTGHPAVTDAAVAPAPDLSLGLAPHAFVVLGERIGTCDLLAYVNAHVPPYRQVLAVHVVDLIPRSPSGRVRRRALLERADLVP